MVLKKIGSRIGVTLLSDIASFPLIIFILNIYGFMITPFTNTFTRYQEHEADIYGLEITKNNHAAATAFLKLQSANLVNPRPGKIIRFFRDDHPTLAERVDFANIYKPWEQGKDLKFNALFK